MALPRAGIPLTDVQDVLGVLNRIALFGGLTDAQLYAVFRRLLHTHYNMGEFIFEEGDEPSEIYIVWRGRVELVLDVGGANLAERVFEVGDCLGETAVIGIQRHTASAVAQTDTDLIVLPRSVLFGLYDTDPKLFGMLILNIAREACRRLHSADKILLHYFAHRP